MVKFIIVKTSSNYYVDYNGMVQENRLYYSREGFSRKLEDALVFNNSDEANFKIKDAGLELCKAEKLNEGFSDDSYIHDFLSVFQGG